MADGGLPGKRRGGQASAGFTVPAGDRTAIARRRGDAGSCPGGPMPLWRRPNMPRELLWNLRGRTSGMFRSVAAICPALRALPRHAMARRRK